MASRDLCQLIDAFNSGELLRPAADTMNLVDLANAIAFLTGAGDLNLTSGAHHLIDLIGPSTHLVFILADGFGMNFVEEMDNEAFIPTHLSMELQSVFPSTTSAALTTLATAKWPGIHAVLGWFLYLPVIDAVTTILRFTRTSDGTDLSKLGVNPNHAFPQQSWMAQIQRESLSLFPEVILPSTYSSYFTNGTRSEGYTSLKHAMDKIITRTKENDGPTLTYLYWPNIDSICHELGTHHLTTTSTVTELDQELLRLSMRLPEDTKVVLTADHGLLDANETQTHWIEPGDELSSCLSKAPSGDAREVYFAPRDGQKSRFRDRFSSRFENRFMLLTVEEATELALFGPEPLSFESRERLGDIVAISLGADAIRYRHTHSKSNVMEKKYASHHSGLTPSEMRIPLIVL
jgi:hypothetical protein